MKRIAISFIVSLIAGGCASDPDYEMEKRLRETTIVTSSQMAQLPPSKKFEESQARYAELSEQSTPAEWKVGAKWRFEIDPLDGRSSNVVVFRITSHPALDTCMSGEWQQLEVVSATGVEPKDPAFSVDGRNLHILVSTGLCDAYDEITGDLSTGGFDGWRASSGMFGSKRAGRVSARAVGGSN
jgi:hypothetical protein